MWTRYVAIGDSTVEGLDDPAGGDRYRGWADRLAEHLAASQGDLLYANLAIRGKRAGEVLAEQLLPALELEPDLVAVVAGLNDVLRPQVDLPALAADLDALFTGVRSTGATAVTVTMPDPPARPLARLVRSRLDGLNAVSRAAAERHGLVLVDLAASPVASNPRLWSDDRLHANTAGHVRVAAALAQALGVPGADGGWREPLPAHPLGRGAELLAAEAIWVRRHVLPWAVRRVRRRSAGDGITAKRPALAPVQGGSQGI